MNTALILAIGVVFHLTYTWSIFDIYFKSPLTHGMTPHHTVLGPGSSAPAKRLVLFVADGLRADKIFEDESRAPYLHNVIQQKGRWGVSHTRVPTESRPGHVAVIAGFYEDVSAVTKGWKMNPVEFDSLFNQSAHSWTFGSPDILPMFKHGATDPNKVDAIMYDHLFEDFASSEASSLDTWVFDKVHDLFDAASSDSRLNAALRQPQVVFFLHLLGIDTNGHAHRPFSPEYLQNIPRVDEGVKSIVELVDAFFGDHETAFVFTADHGMSDLGNHGDGNPDNTRTPLIVWGAGISNPLNVSEGHDSFSKNWPCSNTARFDVNQADIAPMMASLINLPFPMNSVGRIPRGYLERDQSYLSRSLFANSQQILEQFLVKQESKRRQEPFFTPFSGFSELSPEDYIKAIRLYIAKSEWQSAQLKSLELIDICIKGLRYFQTYDWLFLRSVASLGYLGWILFSLVFVYCEYVNEKFTFQMPSK
eukprot:Partr_v1_DN27988_c2_g3_i3_m11368 putative phosphatidylinositol glycan anchor biosynthesis, class N